MSDGTNGEAASKLQSILTAIKNEGFANIGAMVAKLHETAAERDRLLGLEEDRPITITLDISTDSGREAFETRLQSIMEPISKQLAASVSSTSALMENFQIGSLAELGQQMQQVAESNQALVDASIWRSM